MAHAPLRPVPFRPILELARDWATDPVKAKQPEPAMGDVISLEQYRKRLARRNQPAAKAKASGPKKPAAKLPRAKDEPGGKRKLPLEMPVGEPPKKKT